jgi:hypothetical protein
VRGIKAVELSSKDKGSSKQEKALAIVRETLDLDTDDGENLKDLTLTDPAVEFAIRNCIDASVHLMNVLSKHKKVS